MAIAPVTRNSTTTLGEQSAEKFKAVADMAKRRLGEQSADKFKAVVDVATRSLGEQSANRFKAIVDVVNVAKREDAIRKSQEEGYELVSGNPFTDDQIYSAVMGPPNEIAPGIIRAEILVDNGDRRKVMISQSENPDLYDRFVAVDNSFRINDARQEANLPPSSDFDVLNMVTTENDPHNQSRKLTVSEQTWKSLLDDWKVGIENGSIAADDPRAELYTAMRAKGVLDNGIDMTVLDISTAYSAAKVNQHDVRDIIDEAKLNAKIEELYASEAVQSDFQKKQTEAVNMLPNKDEVLSKLDTMAFSEDYAKYIKSLADRGQKELAEADIASTYSALAALDPDRAGDFARSMQLDGLTMDLEKVMTDSSLVSEANTQLATEDVVKTLVSSAKKGVIDLTRRTTETEKFIEEFLGNKQTAVSFGSALKELGDIQFRRGEISQTDIDRVFAKDIYSGMSEGARGAAARSASEMNTLGILGSAGGLISLASGVYQIAGKGGSLADTPEERLAITKEFVSFIAAGSHFTNFASRSLDFVNGTHLTEMLGLDKSLPQIFKGKGTKVDAAPLSTNEALQMRATFQAQLDEASRVDARQLADRLNLNEDQFKLLMDGYTEGSHHLTTLGSTPTTRAFSAFLRVADAGANVFSGVADIVLGALKIKKSTDSGDPAGIAHGSITVGAGVFTAAGGAAQAAGLLGINAARLAAGPLLWAGAALSVALLPFLIVEDLKNKDRMLANKDEVNNFFNNLNRQGILVEGGIERFKFLEQYMYDFGQRDAPDDISIFEYRRDEYEFYVSNGRLPEKGHDDVTHNDFAGDGANLETQLS
ncbi:MULTISPECIES: hypothetical protein [unclassified Phyllobacterium]|uniref:hypothetical protein n=1 Tax=unclassified Phyllobacterium TaxID=2638441 RepID=UPI003012C027